MNECQDEIFFYDELNRCVSSLTQYHAEECDIEPLVEAHPNIIYFYASFGPLKEWDFNEVAHPTLFEMPKALNEAFNRDHC